MDFCEIGQIDHVGVVVRDIGAAVKLYQDVFGLKSAPIETLEREGVKATMLRVGESRIELLEPIDPNGGVGRFLERRGEGMHHLAFRVDDIKGKLEVLKSKGLELIDKEPRKGYSGTIAFVHPRSTQGVLIELVQPFK
ncbi:MAG: methylmalonyl-CoA epimerase [Chloroflexi bacterium]|nr:methylmalonyl-CoA epimerase [Chloroflexota bacterium]